MICGKDVMNSETNETEKCKGPVKPNVVFFSESVANTSFIYALNRLRQDEEDESCGCDLMIVIGSNLNIGPFNTTIDMDGYCPKVLISKWNS